MFKWTVGMAVVDKPPYFFESIRAKFTALSLQIHHEIDEILIVDNNPHPDNPLRNISDKTNGRVRYIELPEPKGTAVPRNRVFEEARNEYVACLDPHVLLYPDTFKAFEEFYQQYGMDNPDVLHGPMMTESRDRIMGTHMNVQWRAEMLGTWAWAWQAPNGLLFSIINPNKDGDWSLPCQYVNLPDNSEEQRDLTWKEIEENGLPVNLSVPGHEAYLHKLGYKQPEHAHPIPGHGMGFFACRKESWLDLPFSPKCRGFGGEEITTGIRFRKAGRLAWCIPGAKWWHDFHRPLSAVPYALTRWDKMRNYVIEFLRMGMDPEPIRQHFSQISGVPDTEWEQALQGVEWPEYTANINPATYSASREEANAKMASNEIGLVPSNYQKPQQKCAPEDAPMSNLETYYRGIAARQSPINVDLPHLRHLAATCNKDDKPGRVVEIVHQSSSAIAILAGNPKWLVSYGSPNGRPDQLKKLSGPDTEYYVHNTMPVGPIQDCDMLFLDVDPHTAYYYSQLLEIHSPYVTRFIVLHDTIVYGKEFNGQPGLIPAVEEFLASNPEWKIAHHHDKQNGLMVLSRVATDDEARVTAPAAEFETIRKVGEKITEIRNSRTEDQKIKIPDFGPGTELQSLLLSIGIDKKSDCGCNAQMAKMNYWGVEGCTKHFNEIVGFLKDGIVHFGWADRMKAAALATIKGLAFKLNPLDPIPSLVKEAIKRAKEKEPTSDAA